MSEHTTCPFCGGVVRPLPYSREKVGVTLERHIATMHPDRVGAKQKGTT